MKKTRSGHYVSRDGATGRFTTVHSRGSEVVVTGRGIATSGSSSRIAKVAAKNMLNYSNNLKRYIKNDKAEIESSLSIATKDQEKLEKKYGHINL